MKIIQYCTGIWDKERMYMFSIVKDGQVFRFNVDRGYLQYFDEDYNYNVVLG